jgi:hypothetical protein
VDSHGEGAHGLLQFDKRLETNGHWMAQAALYLPVVYGQSFTVVWRRKQATQQLCSLHSAESQPAIIISTFLPDDKLQAGGVSAPCWGCLLPPSVLSQAISRPACLLFLLIPTKKLDFYKELIILF